LVVKFVIRTGWDIPNALNTSDIVGDLYSVAVRLFDDVGRTASVPPLVTG
jgi:hypothetical protein